MPVSVEQAIERQVAARGKQPVGKATRVEELENYCKQQVKC